MGIGRGGTLTDDRGATALPPATPTTSSGLRRLLPPRTRFPPWHHAQARAEAPRHSLVGTATWYRYAEGQAAGGPRLRAALGDWRGRTVLVNGVPVLLSDYMGTKNRAKVIDLDAGLFRASAGRCRWACATWRCAGETARPPSPRHAGPGARAALPALRRVVAIHARVLAPQRLGPLPSLPARAGAAVPAPSRDKEYRTASAEKSRRYRAWLREHCPSTSPPMSASGWRSGGSTPRRGGRGCGTRHRAVRHYRQLGQYSFRLRFVAQHVYPVVAAVGVLPPLTACPRRQWILASGTLQQACAARPAPICRAPLSQP